jgi:hypothetical protein
MANRQHNGQQTTQWPTEKVQKDNDLQTIHKTKDRVTRTPLKTGGGLFQFGVMWAICKL